MVESGSCDEIGLSGRKLGGNLDIHSSSQHDVDPCRGTFKPAGMSNIGFVFRNDQERKMIYKICPCGRN